MKTITMKAVVIMALISLGLTINLKSVYAQTTNYSGTWLRNDDQCDPGELSINSIPVKLEISQDAKNLYIKTTVKTGSGEVHVDTDTLNLDGSKRIVLTASKRKKAASLTWSNNNTQFTQTLTVADNEGKPVQDWTQSYSVNGGKTLKVSVDVKDSGQTYHMEEVFDRLGS